MMLETIAPCAGKCSRDHEEWSPPSGLKLHVCLQLTGWTLACRSRAGIDLGLGRLAGYRVRLYLCKGKSGAGEPPGLVLHAHRRRIRRTRNSILLHETFAKHVSVPPWRLPVQCYTCMHAGSVLELEVSASKLAARQAYP
jgi:hypothetical protein